MHEPTTREFPIPRAADASSPPEAITMAPASEPPTQGPLTGEPQTPRSVPSLPPIPGYEILSELGRGGMGVVYQARQVKLNRIVALKMILAGAHAEPGELQRFRNEAEAVARLQHPNVVQVYEVGEHDGLPFFSMEFCAGGSLAHKLRGAPLPPREAAALIEKLALALHTTHQSQVIHRDLKPANVLLQRKAGISNPKGETAASDAGCWVADFEPKVTDFGLAKKLDEVGLTQSGAVMGTPSYMAPEQAAGQAKAVGPAADVYALGAILYECLTGRPPFKAATRLDTLLQVIGAEPAPPSRLNPRVPRDLETICLKCLNKEPPRRYAGAQALAEDLRCWQGGKPIAARPAGRLERCWRWCRRNPAVAALLAGVAASLLVGAAVAVVFAIRAERHAATALANEERAEKEKRDAELAREETADNLYFAEMGLAAQAAEAPGGSRRLSEILGRWRPAVHETDRRGWEWYCFRALADQSELTILARGPVTAVCWSPDGRRLASDDGLGTIRIWDARSGRELATLQAPRLPGSLHALGWSPDGRFLAGGGGKVRIWDMLHAGKEVASLTGVKHAGFCLSWHPDSRRLACQVDSAVKVWDVVAKRELKTLELDGWVWGASWSPDGKKLATAATPPMLKVFDAATWQPLAAFPMPIEKSRPGLSWSRDGRQLAAPGFEKVFLWDMSAYRALPPVPIEDDNRLVGLNYPQASCWGPSPFLAVARYNATVEIHDLSKRTRRLLRGHETAVKCVSWAPDGSRLATGGADGTLRIWHVEEARDPAASLDTHLGGGTTLVWTPDGQRLMGTYSWDKGATFVRMVDRSTGRVSSWEVKLPLQGPAFSSGGTRLASRGTDADPRIRLLDLPDGGNPLFLSGHKRATSAVTWSPDGKRLASAAPNDTGNSVKVWDTITGKEIATLPFDKDQPSSLAWSPDGKRLAAGGSSGGVQVWDGTSYQKLVFLKGLHELIGPLAWSPDGRRLAAAGTEQVIRVWDVGSGQEVVTLPGHMGIVLTLAWSPDGNRLASSGVDRGLKLWDVAKGKEVISLHGQRERVGTPIWSPDGFCLAATDYPVIRFWDALPGYHAERSPVLLPLLDKRLGAQPASVSDLRLRAEVYARQGAWESAVTDWQKAEGLVKDSGQPWFTAGWWMRGPFASALAPDEAGDLDPLRPLPGGIPAARRWRDVFPSANGCLDLARLVPGKRSGCVEVLVRMYSPKQQRVTAGLGSPGPLAAWLNGRSIYARDQVRLVAGNEEEGSREAADEKVSLELDAGWNALLFRVGLGTEVDRFCLAMEGSVKAFAPPDELTEQKGK